MTTAAGRAPQKSPDAFRTISEVSTELDLPQHVLRFWETRFTQIHFSNPIVALFQPEATKQLIRQCLIMNKPVLLRSLDSLLVELDGFPLLV